MRNFCIIKNAIMQNVCDFSEIDGRFKSFRLDLYVSWIPATDSKMFESVPSTVLVSPLIIKHKQQAKHIKAKIRVCDNDYSLIKTALCDFINYNTFWDNANKTLCYSQREIGVRPWCEIPAVSYGNRMPGLDYNKIITWWTALSNKQDFKHTKNKNNCVRNT